MLFAATRVNLEHFVRDLMAGDPVVWAIVVGVVLFSGFGLYQMYRAFSTNNTTESD